VVTQKQIPLLDLQTQHRQIRDEVLAAVTRVIDSQKFVLGAELEAFEREIADYCRTTFAIGCASGTDALILALMASGVGPGDQVITTPYSFFATAGAIAHLGAIPVFADVDPATFNIDPQRAAEVIERSPRARAIIAVHLFGGCADMEPLCATARERGLVLIEDAAQAIGAEYRGRRTGGMGRIGCFSFYPSKNLSAFGEGGLLTTQDESIAQRLRALRVHGSTEKYVHQWVGINSRLDALQAAVLRVKLRHLDSWTERRQRNARFYRDLLAVAPVDLPCPAPYQTRHVFNQFVIRIRQRDAVRAYLASQGVGTEVYYPVPLHLQPCFSNLGYHSRDFPVAEALARETLALPIYPELSEDDIAYVSSLLTERRP
jgi:dTDP-4-amino-4,6-dideoxygalactose transaminase